MPPIVDSFSFQFYICKANWEGGLCDEFYRFYWLFDISVGHFLEYFSQSGRPSDYHRLHYSAAPKKCVWVETASWVSIHTYCSVSNHGCHMTSSAGWLVTWNCEPNDPFLQVAFNWVFKPQQQETTAKKKYLQNLKYQSVPPYPQTFQRTKL